MIKGYSNLMDHPSGATALDPDELNGLKYEHISTRGELDQLEQASIIDGLRWLEKQRTPDVLTEAFVLELHQRLFGSVWKWAGMYRRTEKNLGVDPTQIAIQLHQLLADANHWIDHSTYPPLEIAARFHHRLVSIHPFPNGNGRHARIMADAVLTKRLKEPPIDWAGGYGTDDMEGRRKQYIAALRKADGHDFSALLEFVGV